MREDVVNPFVEKVLQTARRERLWEPGDAIVAAVSGGPDSTALLHALHKLSESERLTITAAHVNHGFRGEESDREAEAVAALCERLGPLRL